MNTEVIIIIVVAVLVLLGVVAFFVLKKEKFSTTQQPTAHGVIGATILNIDSQVSDIKSYTNALSSCINITALYISTNIDDINTYITSNIGSTVSSTNSLFVTSLAAIQELSSQYAGNPTLNSQLASISNNLFIIYLNMRLNEEIVSSINNTESYKTLLTLFPQFPKLFNNKSN